MSRDKKKDLWIGYRKDRLNLGQICGNLTLSLIITFLDWRVKFLKKMCRCVGGKLKHENLTQWTRLIPSFHLELYVTLAWILAKVVFSCFAEERELAIDKMSFGDFLRLYMYFFYLRKRAFSAKPQIRFFSLLFFTARHGINSKAKTHVEVVRNCWAEACGIIAHVSGVQAVVLLIKYLNFVTFRCHYCCCCWNDYEYYCHYSFVVFPQVQIPVLLLNALDDPLVPEELYVTPHNHVSKYCFLRLLLFRREARVSHARVPQG